MAKHLKTLQVCTAICHVYIIVLSIYVDYIVYIYICIYFFIQYCIVCAFVNTFLFSC